MRNHVDEVDHTTKNLKCRILKNKLKNILLEQPKKTELLIFNKVCK